MAQETVTCNILLPDRTAEGWAHLDAGRVTDWGEGDPEERARPAGWITPPLCNAHTHVADACLRGAPGKPDTVGPLFGPGGWKHQRLAETDDATLQDGIRTYAQEMASCGTDHFIDFREGGVAGARLLRSVAEDLPAQPFILGRPAAGGFDETETDALLRLCDGIGLSGMRDLPADVLEAWAEACHKARKPFAVHVSEDTRDDIDAVLALEPSFVVHMTQATRGDLQAVADEKVPIVVCPRSNARFGWKVPVPKMLEAGCTVAVGTDNGMLQNGDLLAELALLRGFWPDLPDEILLRMATWNGHRLTGRTPSSRQLRPVRPIPTATRTRPVLAPREET